MSALTVGMVHFSDYALDSRIQREAQALAERGDHVHCVCIGEAGTQAVGAGRIATHPIACEKPRSGPASYLRAYARFFAGAARALTTLDRRLGFDLVQIHNMPNFLTAATLAPRRRGVPVILDMHDTFPELFSTTFGVGYRHPLSRAIYQEERLSARLADHLITVTDAAKRLLNDRGVGRDRTTVVMNSPDERIFGPQRAPVRIPDEGPIRIVYHGGTSERFGVESLIDATKRLIDEEVDVSLNVYGAFDENSDLLSRARAVPGERVRLAAKPTPFEEIPEKLARAHIGVVPTLRNDFTQLLLPVKLLEYIHMGIPAVCSRLPVVEDHFTDDELWFYEPGSPGALKAAIREAISDPAEAMRRADRAGKRIADYCWLSQRDRYLALADQLTSRAAAASGPSP